MQRARTPRRRFAVGIGLLVVLMGALAGLPGEPQPVTAREAPPIDQVVKGMEAIPGFFTVYTGPDGRLLLEIQEEQFGKDFLVVVQMARGIGESFLLTGFPLTTEMLTFRLRGGRVELVARNPYFRAEAGTPLERMVQLGFRESIKRAFQIVAQDPERGRYLIDATGLFVNDWPGLSYALPFIYGVGFRLDPRRSTLVYVKGFPENVEIEVDLTFQASFPFFSRTVPDPTSLPVSLHYSVLKLPDEPMKPRLADDRVGYFVTAFKDFSRQGGRTNTVRVIHRWRLEKKDPWAPISEPKKPIVFYLENTIPEAYRPYIKEGVEAWNKAFEAAGFKNAIVAVDQPDDPDFDPEDARYSTIRWVPSVTAVFAMGPSDVDPRSGEILNADILFTEGWVRALTGEYDLLTDVQSPLDFLTREAEALRLAFLLNPRAAGRLCAFGTGLLPHLLVWRLALQAQGVVGPDGEVPLEYVGAALREITMHEVGHALGLRHNFKASAAIPYLKLHDENYTRRYGVSASVMDYNPPNVSPDPRRQGEYYSSTVGPYDVWAIQYGYMPVPGETLEAPHPRLRAIAEEHFQREHLYGTDEDAWLYPYALDPLTNMWDLGDDPIAYYQEVQRLVDRLWRDVVKRMVPEGGELWPVRSAIHALLYEQTRGYFYALKAVGGVRVTRAHRDDPMGLKPFEPLSADEQRRALRFVLEAFTPLILREFPKELLDLATPERWRDWASSWRLGTRFTYPIHEVIAGIREALLEMAFWPERLMRIRDNAYRSNEPDPFTLDELFTGFTDAIWGDVLEGRPPADSFQRQIQSLYVDKLLELAGLRVAPTGERTRREPAPTPTPDANADADADAERARAWWAWAPWTDAGADVGVGVAQFPSSLRVPPRAPEAKALALVELQRIARAIEALLARDVPLEPLDEAHLLEVRARIERALGLSAGAR